MLEELQAAVRAEVTALLRDKVSCRHLVREAAEDLLREFAREELRKG